jgi:hypothetical protein
MKKVFVYFAKKAIVSNTVEGISFINNCGFKANNQNIQTMDMMFTPGNEDHPWCKELAPSGIGNYRIKVYNALADTLEQHELILKESQERSRIESEAKAKIEEQKELEAKAAKTNDLLAKKRGWYHVSIWLEYYKPSIKDLPTLTDATFTGNVIAESGMDAYHKAVEEITRLYDVVNYADATSELFYTYFLGVKTDQGFSTEKWNEWKNEGSI